MTSAESTAARAVSVLLPGESREHRWSLLQAGATLWRVIVS